MRWISGIVLGLLVWIVIAVAVAASMDWSAAPPGSLESGLMTKVKMWRVGGKNDKNPLAASPDSLKEGTEHFRHHCQICHGLDGQNTGVPFAAKMSPPVADLASARVQNYTDGQLKWIIDHGIRMSGMPGWRGTLSDEEGWAIVDYIRHLPPKGSLGAPSIFEEEEHEHEMSSGEHEAESEKSHHH